MQNKVYSEECFEFVCRELEKNATDYSLYFLLGNYYERRNINQAWLCYENAEFYCNNSDDLEIIRERKHNIETLDGWSVHKTSIVILSYNMKDICQGCIESIRQYTPQDSYEMIVVDNASTDGIVDWLRQQKDIKLICNSENKGFPYGCNQGIEAAEADNDIFLLNNDTIVMPNSIFWLRMGLYENECIGATGSVSNMIGNDQQIRQTFENLDQYYLYALKNNIAKRNPYEKKVWLAGFAMLIKRAALNSVGFLDTRFSPGGFEDNDISIRLQYAGWQLLLCTNSFIFHYGNGNGEHAKIWTDTARENLKRFKEKWNFDITYYTWARQDIIDLIKEEYDASISVLEIGCGCGATLARILYQWPNATVRGIELVEDVAKIGANYLDIITGNIETMELPDDGMKYDYIIFGDVLEHLYDPEAALLRLKPYLKETGMCLCSIPNLMHESVILSLLRGKFEYQESGILDRTHIRFFTLESIIDMMCKCGFGIEKFTVMGDCMERTEEDKKFLDALYQIPGIANRDLFAGYEYIFSAKQR